MLVLSANVFGQKLCLTDDEAKKAIESIQTPIPTVENKKLRKELIDMRNERLKIAAKVTGEPDKNKDLLPEEKTMGERHLLRVCQMVKDNGWLTKEALKEDGLDAFLYLIANNKAFELQREIFPVVAAAAKKGYIGNPILAAMIDSIRTGAGAAQIFGTQASIRNGVIYLFPLLNEQKIDEWRKAYDLPPLAAEIRMFQARYLLPVLKSQRMSPPAGANRKNSDKNSDTAILGISNDDNEILKVETKLVSLNIRVFTPDLKVLTGIDLAKNDFTILEDGVEQEPAFFSTENQPFDLVLLLDFSGSTQEKRGLIKKAAERFVELVRPGDRVAIVAFATEIQMVADLTADRTDLMQKIDDIDITGSSPIWESLQFTYDNIIKKESSGRRSAVVFMTDGQDNSRNLTFTDVMETVRHGDTTIFSVCINTGFGRGTSNDWAGKYVKEAQDSLSMLAEETGGQFYNVDNLKGLNGVYEQVINDLAKVYSIGYEPRNDFRDGGWRNLTVRVKTQPNLVAKTRRGYYAN